MVEYVAKKCPETGLEMTLAYNKNTTLFNVLAGKMRYPVVRVVLPADYPGNDIVSLEEDCIAE